MKATFPSRRLSVALDGTPRVRTVQAREKTPTPRRGVAVLVEAVHLVAPAAASITTMMHGEEAEDREGPVAARAGALRVLRQQVQSRFSHGLTERAGMWRCS